jgi:HEPN domain-containing protein
MPSRAFDWLKQAQRDLEQAEDSYKAERMSGLVLLPIKPLQKL